MKIENIKEIIFCNKNGKLAAYAKDYKNHFTEISVREGIRKASKIEYRILQSKEEIEELQREVANKTGRKVNSLGYAAATLATAGALIMGSTSCALTSDTSNVNDTNATQITAGTDNASEPIRATITETTAEPEVTEEAQAEEEDFDSLLQASESSTQRRTIQMMSDYIDYFNGDFANHYAETVQVRDSEGNLTGEQIEVRPALLWDYEVPALTIAYNDYSTRELQEIFNGTELDANTLDANFKNGTLQLFGAYVISDREHPVNLSALIESPEGQAFVQKYEDLFYDIKDAKTEEERIEAVNAFYRELHRDFPIDSYNREVGISYMDSRNMLLDQPYKLAIAPMVAATETMYQNLAIDHTLSDIAIKYFNDNSACTIAYNSFQKAERATEMYTINDRFADYEILSRLKRSQLRSKGYDVISDINRDLSQLTRFRDWVDGHFDVIEGEWAFVGNSTILSTTVETYEEIVDQWTTSTTKTWAETTTTRTSDRDEAIAKAGREKVEEAERKADEEIEDQNRKAREEAERRADEEQARQQRIEDEHAQEVRDEVAQDDQNTQKAIEDANRRIDNGDSVNETDLDADFDENHSKDDGTLDTSVENISTDGTGAVSADTPLPDPSETESDFYERHRSTTQAAEEDVEAFAYDYDEEVATVETAEPVVEETYSTDEVETVEPVETTEYVETTTSDDYESDDVEEVYYDYSDIDYEEEYTTSTDEELVDAYVESLAEEPTTSTSKSL